MFSINFVIFPSSCALELVGSWGLTHIF